MRKVYILGSGASAGYDKSNVGLHSPTAKDFFQKFMYLIDNNYLERDQFKNLFDFLRKYYFFGESSLRNEELDIEEVLTILDLEPDDSEFQQARNELIEMIFLTLNKILYGERCPYHKKLAENLEPSDTVITFNWDLLLDNVLAENANINYSGHFARFYRNGRWCNNNMYTGVKLLKLHGSLNWMFCKSCRRNYCYILSGKVGADQIVNPEDPRTKCPQCARQMKPIIIPPTLAKQYKNELLDELWQEALVKLKDADEIIIIGYSLPVTDFKAKWLFMKSVAMRQNQLNKLTVVDKYLNDNLKRKFKSIFKVRNNQFNGIRGEIKDYIDASSKIL